MKTVPLSQSDYLLGQQDGTRYYADGHTELAEKLKEGSHAYQLGFESAKDMPAAQDPGYAT
jgi:hypothetical protein